MGFDLKGALGDGYTAEEIVEFLLANPNLLNPAPQARRPREQKAILLAPGGLHAWLTDVMRHVSKISHYASVTGSAADVLMPPVHRFRCDAQSLSGSGIAQASSAHASLRCDDAPEA